MSYPSLNLKWSISQIKYSMTTCASIQNICLSHVKMYTRDQWESAAFNGTTMNSAEAIQCASIDACEKSSESSINLMQLRFETWTK